MRHPSDRVVLCCVALSLVFTGLIGPSFAQAAASKVPQADRVLLVSIAGMHEFDFTRFVAANPDSTLAKLRKRGVSYTQAFVPRPSDSSDTGVRPLPGLGL